MKTALAIAAAVLIAVPASAVVAQYQADDIGSPLEEFLRGIGQDNPNRPLRCDITRRINRTGDIVWMRMECRAFDSARYGR